MHLEAGATLQNGRYRIEKLLGQGGFGITYLAVQSGLDRKVAIKEFFMKELCSRDETTSHVTLGTEGGRGTVEKFREKFLKEARNLAKLEHPHIVRIIEVFEENGTAYYAMNYAEGGSLDDQVKKQGYLSEPVATNYIKQVAKALDFVHQRKMNHLDVKPANIMLNANGDCMLIDFGLSKQYDASTGGQTSTTPVGVSEGYAPLEQYRLGGVTDFSPEADVYALGATFFKLLTGITPPNAFEVDESGLPVGSLRAKGVSENAIVAITKAMESRKRDRMKSVKEFLDLLDSQKPVVSSTSTLDNDATVAIPNAAPVRRTTPSVAPPAFDAHAVPAASAPKNKPMWLWGGVAAVALVIVGCVIFFVTGSDDSDDLSVAKVLSCPDAHHPHVIDLGLPSGTKWSCCNLGASSPEEYGDYMSWGETMGYMGGKTIFDDQHHKYCYGEYGHFSKYNREYEHGHVDNLEELEVADDAAYTILGPEWRTPLDGQLDELTNDQYTTREWTQIGGTKGLLITSKLNQNKIFLPAAGDISDGSETAPARPHNLGAKGYYWSRSRGSGDCASWSEEFLGFDSISCELDYFGRHFGCSIRPVHE